MERIRGYQHQPSLSQSASEVNSPYKIRQNSTTRYTIFQGQHSMITGSKVVTIFGKQPFSFSMSYQFVYGIECYQHEKHKIAAFDGNSSSGVSSNYFHLPRQLTYCEIVDEGRRKSSLTRLLNRENSENTNHLTRFQVLMPVNVNITVFPNVTSCNLVGI